MTIKIPTELRLPSLKPVIIALAVVGTLWAILRQPAPSQPPSDPVHRVGLGSGLLSTNFFVPEIPVCVGSSPTQMLPAYGSGWGVPGMGSVEIINPAATSISCTTSQNLPPGNDSGPSTFSVGSTPVTIQMGFSGSATGGLWCSSTVPQDSGVFSNCTQVFVAVLP